MAQSYWSSYTPPWGKHTGIPLDDYCIPEDAALVKCDMQSFTCKDIPVFSFQNNSPLEKEDIEEIEEGFFLQAKQIVLFLKFLKKNKERYFPPEGSVKWNFCPYSTLRFSRVSKNNFIVFGSASIIPLNWRHIMRDIRYGKCPKRY